MPIVYHKLFKLMKEQGLSTYKIQKDKIIPQSTLQKLRKNKNVSTDSIARLCEALKCQPGDIMEYVSDVDNSNEQNNSPE